MEYPCVAHYQLLWTLEQVYKKVKCNLFTVKIGRNKDVRIFDKHIESVGKYK
jgi:hypothetical protein